MNLPIEYPVRRTLLHRLGWTLNTTTKPPRRRNFRLSSWFHARTIAGRGRSLTGNRSNQFHTLRAEKKLGWKGKRLSIPDDWVATPWDAPRKRRYSVLPFLWQNQAVSAGRLTGCSASSIFMGAPLGLVDWPIPEYCIACSAFRD